MRRHENSLDHQLHNDVLAVRVETLGSERGNLSERDKNCLLTSRRFADEAFQYDESFGEVRRLMTHTEEKLVRSQMEIV